MAKLNAAGREIWFERWLWSYMPIHWKGWGLMLVVILAANACVWLGLGVISWLGRPDWEPFPFLALLPWVIVMWIVTERHCP